MSELNLSSLYPGFFLSSMVSVNILASIPQQYPCTYDLYCVCLFLLSINCFSLFLRAKTASAVSLCPHTGRRQLHRGTPHVYPK